MAGFLTHLFLPLTALYVLRRDVFPHPVYLGLAGFALLSDADKFLGRPGLFHSFVTLLPLALVILTVERAWRGEWRYAPVIVALIGSHLVLDFVAGGLVPVLFPLIETGVGLQYPIRTVFGVGPVGIAFEGPIVTVRTTAPRSGYNTYGFVTGGGIANALLFAVIYTGREWRAYTNRRGAQPGVAPSHVRVVLDQLRSLGRN